MVPKNRSFIIVALACLAAGVLAGAAPTTPPTPSTTARPAETAPTSTRKSLTVNSLQSVDAVPITLTSKLLDRAKGLVPKNYDNEGGRCETTFRSDLHFEHEIPQVKRTEDGVTAKITCYTYRVRIALALTLWLPAKPSNRLLDHEETHRAISERVYAEGIEALAATLKQMEGKTYEAQGKTEAEAIALVKKLPEQEFNDAFARLFPTRAALLNDRFDSLTHHGLARDKSNEEIMLELFKPATTGPATQEEDH